MSDQEDLIIVARIVKVRGLRGEVVADLLTDFPDRFERLSSLIAVLPDGSRRSLQIEEQWFHGNRLVLKFSGFDKSHTVVLQLRHSTTRQNRNDRSVDGQIQRTTRGGLVRSRGSGTGERKAESEKSDSGTHGRYLHSEGGAKAATMGSRS